MSRITVREEQSKDTDRGRRINRNRGTGNREDQEDQQDTETMKSRTGQNQVHGSVEVFGAERPMEEKRKTGYYGTVSKAGLKDEASKRS